MNKHILVLFCGLLITSCQNQKSYNLANKSLGICTSKNSVIKMSNTGYCFNGSNILKIAYHVPDNIYGAFYFNSNFILLDTNQCLYTVNINSACEQEYKNRHYVIRLSPFDSIPTNKSEYCSPFILKVMDFNIKTNDTCYVYENKKWFYIKDKYFNSNLNDTLYTVIHHLEIADDVIVTISKQHGILGIATKKKISNYGEPEVYKLYNVIGDVKVKDCKIDKDSYNTNPKFFDSKVDLSLIKEFYRCE